jgi:type IV secretion system protein VirB8
MSKAETVSEHDYFVEARTWDEDRLVHAEKSRRVAWWVAGGFGAVALLAVGAIAVLTPLHRIEPYEVRVDNATGMVDTVSALKDSKESYTEAVTKHFLLRYVLSREGYSRQAAASNYEAVGLMSTSVVAKRYFDSFRPENPASPLNIYGNSTTVELKIKSITFLGENIAVVRYAREIYRKTGEKPETTQWVATVGFKYSAANMRERDRLINPLGFQVTEYRTDPDSLETK